MIVASLPIPPSANALKRNSRHSRRPFDSKAYREWKATAGKELQAMRLSPVTGRYHFILRLPQKMRGDVDNRLKAALDLFRALHLTDDDRHAVSATAVRCDDVQPGQCLVVITQDSTLTQHAAGRGVAEGETRVLPLNPSE